MTDLERRIHNDMVKAMKSRNAAVLDPLRMLKAALQNASVEKGRESELSEDEIITVVGRLVKQRREAAAQYESGGASDRAAEELAEVEVLGAYLPAQMTESELNDLVRKVVSETGASGPRDMGKIMGAIMPRVKGRAEGNLVREVVRRALAPPEA